MDVSKIGIYSFLTLTEQELGQFLDEKKTFVLEDVDLTRMSEVVAFLEKAMEVRSLKCRVYTKGRAAAMGVGLLVPLVGLAETAIIGAAIAAHNVATWNPDYEIAKNPVSSTLTVTYQKKQ